MAGGAEETRGETGETGAGGSPVCSSIGTSPHEDYHKPAHPCLIQEGEDGKLEAWPAIDQW